MNRIIIYTIIAILIVVALITIESLSTAPKHSASSAELVSMDNVALNSSMLNSLRLPASVFAQVGTGGAGGFPSTVNATPMTIDGKPAIVYIGADYCPYCAAERWALVLALSRFGNFTSLHYMTSSASDYSPNTPTFTFYNSSYSSPYISFIEVELTTNKLVNGAYPSLQTPTPAENAIISKYDPSESVPFVDFANYSVQLGSNYYPTILQNQSWSAIISNASNPNSEIAQYVVGSANLVSAEICIITNSTPPVCSQQYLRNIMKELKA